jgi:hypothetical protein
MIYPRTPAETDPARYGPIIALPTATMRRILTRHKLNQLAGQVVCRC